MLVRILLALMGAPVRLLVLGKLTIANALLLTQDPHVNYVIFEYKL